MVARALFSFFIPGGLLFVTALIFVHVGALAEWLPAIVRIYPYAVLGAGILLGWRFNQSRLVFAILVLALADRSLLHFASDSIASTDLGRMVYNAVAILLPLNLAVLSLIKERGIVTVRGIWRMSLILLQPLAIALVCHYQHFGICAYLKYSIVEATLFAHISLPQPALLAFGAAFIVFAIGFVKHQGAVESSFFWVLVSAFFGLATGRPGPLSTIYFATAGLILVISVIETSYSLAFQDELTGLPTRRALNEALFKLGNRYAVAMLDIDFFKKFNDRHGHDVGDQVLRMVASILSKVTGGKAFRYGGEEFTVIFPGKCADEAIPHLEQLRKAAASSGFTIRSRNRPRTKPKNPKAIRRSQKKVSITISIGVAERDERQTSPQEVVKAADKALYRAKKAGRNRVST